jgi:hypothetical protein
MPRWHEEDESMIDTPRPRTPDHCLRELYRDNAPSAMALTIGVSWKIREGPLLQLCHSSRPGCPRLNGWTVTGGPGLPGQGGRSVLPGWQDNLIQA